MAFKKTMAREFTDVEGISVESGINLFVSG